MNIKIWLIICLVLATVSIAAVSVYLIIVLIQIKKTVKELEGTLFRVNGELDSVNKLSKKVFDFTEKLSSPLISAGTVLYHVFASFNKKKKNGCKEEKNV